MGIFSFFRRREEKEILEELTKNLSNSFRNIRKDIIDLHKRIDAYSSKDENYINHLLFHESRLSRIETQLNILLNTKDKKEKQILLIEEKFKDIISQLTETQQAMFLTLYQLQLQLNTKNISIKSIAKVLYPQKEYDSIRSTISEYLSILANLGLIEKKRIGKQTYVSITETGESTINKLKKKKKVKVKNKSQ